MLCDIVKLMLEKSVKVRMHYQCVKKRKSQQISKLTNFL